MIKDWGYWLKIFIM